MTNEELKSALWHLFYKNHDFAPTSCSGCEMVQRALNEYVPERRPEIARAEGRER